MDLHERIAELSKLGAVTAEKFAAQLRNGEHVGEEGV